ncbi:hypothetical protein [Asticcacaulis sp.]|uniref:hypothetical protein n=1 Tax=Asticcacaulis sp. TaxID=1872648 RepID=UPI00262B0B19|nr:hypothetical protein [Asticcacaulis sp.]
MEEPKEAFCDLARRLYGGHHPALVPETVSLRRALTQEDDPLHIIAYLRSVGITVTSLPDLLAINDDPAEEELHAYPVREGIAVSVASEDAWQIFTP